MTSEPAPNSQLTSERERQLQTRLEALHQLLVQSAAGDRAAPSPAVGGTAPPDAQLSGPQAERATPHDLAGDALPATISTELVELAACLTDLEAIRREETQQRASDETPRAAVNGGETPPPGWPPAASPGDSREGPAPAPRIGRFIILRELGRGGLGMVLEADDPLLHRRVALKVPRPEAMLDPQLRLRFLREAQAAARLTHPHIVAVYEVGEVGPIAYIASALIHGPSLSEWLRQQPGSVDARLAAATVAALADAMQYAHTQGVLHRDLKPSNVLLAPEPNADAAAQSLPRGGWSPKITDFGLAKLLDGSGEETRTGVIIGTPNYMAPEQARADHARVGPATDVYALGAILYELLCRQPPFRGASAAETLNLLTSAEPTAPRTLNSQLPRDVEAIVLRALEKLPERRYASCGELADDLRRFLAGESTKARPLSTAQRWVRAANRNLGVTALLAVVAMLLLTLTTVSTVAAVRIARSRDEARETAESERAAREEVGRALQAEQAAQQNALRQQAEAESQARAAAQVSDFLVSLFMTADPLGSGTFGLQQGDEIGRNLTLRDLLDRGAEQAEKSLAAQPIVRATLLDTLGRVYSNLGLLKQAEPLLREAFELRKQHPEREEELATSLTNVGNLLRWQGKYAESEKTLREATSIQRRANGADSMQTADSEFYLALTLIESNRIIGGRTPERDQEALTLLEHLHSVRLTKLGPAHRDVRAATALLAFALYSMDRRAEAMAKLPSIVSLDKEGSALMSLVFSFQNAAEARKSQKFDQAEKFYRRALELSETRFGKGHLLTLMIQGDMGGLFRDMGRMADYDRNAREVATTARRQFPRGHPALIEGVNEWLPYLMPLGNYDEVIELLDYRTELCDRYYGPSTMRDEEFAFTRAHVQIDQGRLAEAQAVIDQLEQRTLEVDISEVEFDFIQTRITFLRGLLCEQRGDDASAERAFRSTLEHPAISNAGWWYMTERLARAIHRVRPEDRQAEDLLSHGVPRNTRIARYADTMLLDLYLCDILIDRGQLDVAGPALESAHAFVHSKVVPGSYYIGFTDSVYGAYRAAIGQHEEAEKLLLAGLENLRQSRGERHVLTRDAAGRLARFYRAQGNPAEEQKYAAMAAAKLE